MLDTLREIGRRLKAEALREVPADVSVYYGQKGLPRGAAGDRTFPLDRRAEEIALSLLESSGEPLSVISEEAGFVELNGGGRTVLIDPVDGSRNAVTGIPYFGTSIAVADGQSLRDVSLSYVINLPTGEEFWALRGEGAFKDGVPISTQDDDVIYLVAYEARSPGRDVAKILPLISEARRTRCLGATALDLCYLSAAGISVFVAPAPSRSFDFAGGWLLVREAGGVVTDLSGGGIERLELGLKSSASLLASGNDAIHRKAMGLLASPGAPWLGDGY